MTAVALAIVSVEQAAELLGLPPERLAPWLREKNLVRLIAGEERVSLKVIEMLFESDFEARDDGLVSTAEAAVLLGMSRATLDRLAAAAPTGVPGGPTNIGTGKRQHYRWDPSTVAAWVTAVNAARTRARPPSRRRPRKTESDSAPVDWKSVRRA